MRSKYSATLVLGFLVITRVASAPYNNLQGEAANDEAARICPRIVSRAEWSARAPRTREPLASSPTPYVVVHHGGSAGRCRDEKSCAAIVRAYQNYHMDTHGWFDIGYSFVIGEDGNAYEARGWDLGGAHAPGYNTQSIGVCIIGSYNDFLPDEAALTTLRALMRCGVALGKVRPDFEVIGHRQARNTQCPGDTLYKYVQSLPNWTANPTPVYSTNQTAMIPITVHQLP